MTKLSSQQKRKKVIKDFFGLVMQGRQMEGLRYFSQDCVQHNPYVKEGMKELFDSMAAVQRSAPMYSDPDFEIKSLVAEGDMVAVYTVLRGSKSNPKAGGLRQVHLFRFGKDGKIVEYWDVSQMIGPEMPNVIGAF
jgi:predicted SnoaL-like aldol condensation-catalyzing enzyme